MGDFSVSGVVLAAGKGKRFGKLRKQLVFLRGFPLILWSLSHAISSSLNQVYLAVADDDDETILTISKFISLDTIGIIRVENPEMGRWESVKSAVQLLKNDCGGICFLPGDMPFIFPSMINRLKRGFEISLAKMAAATRNNEKAHPVIFGKELFPEMENSKSDKPGIILFEKYKNDAYTFDITDFKTQIDIDNMSDLVTANEYAEILNLTLTSDPLL